MWRIHFVQRFHFNRFSIRALSANKDWEIQLNDIFPSHSMISKWVDSYLSTSDAESRQRICTELMIDAQQQLTPDKSKIILAALSTTNDGIKFGMTLRGDVLELLPKHRQNTGLLALDTLLSQWLFAVFCVGALKLQRVTFDNSSGLLLEKIAAAEAVHRIRALSEMKNRLTNGRRCFGLFHPCLPNDPLTFVHVALAPGIVTSMRDIYSSIELSAPEAVIYYSINSPHHSLSGLNIAATLLKKTALHLQTSIPSLKIHSTLSPIPGFLKWLKSLKESDSPPSFPSNYLTQLSDGIQIYNDTNGLSSPLPNNSRSLVDLVPHLLEVLSKPDWYINEIISESFREPLTWLGYYYLICTKGKPYLEGNLTIIPPLDPVARFHLRNGASLLQINWLANISPTGLSTSAGLMVNYKYDLVAQEENILNFLRTGGIFPLSDVVPQIFLSK